MTGTRTSSTPSSSSHPRLRSRRVAGLRPITLAALVILAACQDGVTGPDALGPDPASHGKTVAGAIELLAPADGSVLDGATTFAARLIDWDLASYKMFWSVDGGSLNYMEDSPSGAPHKAAMVDVGGWSWNGAGPYTVAFEGRSKKGNKVVARTSVQIFIGGSEPTPTEPPPDDPPPADGNPLAGADLWVDPQSNARQTADAWYATRPDDAAQLEKIAQRSQADWFGDWNRDVRTAVDGRTTPIVNEGALPVYVIYNIPVRDCGSYSGGGATSADAYRQWIRDFATGLAGRAAVVVVEPDALAAMDCLDSARQDERYALLNDAIDVLAAAGALAYLDAGHPAWQPVDLMAERLTRAGIERAAGFALNVSNFVTTAENNAYGEALSQQTGGARFVIDTSRNGLGATADHEWCNPEGRSLGAAPTTNAGYALVDALLWLKRPGESDGECNGGPSAGTWWAEYALGLAQRAEDLVASTLVAAGGQANNVGGP